jgi:hypothetical protein
MQRPARLRADLRLEQGEHEEAIGRQFGHLRLRITGGGLDALWCASPGNCGGGGSAIAGFDQYGDILNGAFVVGERDGKWAVSETPPGLAALNAGRNAAVNIVACPLASTCAAAGFYTDAAGHQQPFVEGSV